MEVLSNSEQLVTWNDLRSSYCRLYICQDDRVVPIEWPIQRIYAWFEGTALSNILLASELDKAIYIFAAGEKHAQPVHR